MTESSIIHFHNCVLSAAAVDFEFSKIKIKNRNRSRSFYKSATIIYSKTFRRVRSFKFPSCDLRGSSNIRTAEARGRFFRYASVDVNQDIKVTYHRETHSYTESHVSLRQHDVQHER